jgi:hypothetical protein
MILTCRCRAVRTEKIEELPRYGILDTYFPAGPSGALISSFYDNMP